MIKYDRFAFATAPRTASTWFIQAASLVGLGDAQKAKVHTPPWPKWKAFTVTLVRHPYNWLESYFAALQGGVTYVEAVDKFSKVARRAADSAGFINYVARKTPGAVGEMFDSYRATTVLRVEDLPWCAMEFFESLGADKGKIRNLIHLPPHNTTRIAIPEQPKYRRLIIESELVFCERYDYL